MKYTFETPLGEQFSFARKEVKRIDTLADLPMRRFLARYKYVSGSSIKTDNLAARNRQVLDLLIAAPIWSASRLRIGPAVQNLREAGFDIKSASRSFKHHGVSLRECVYILTGSATLEGEV